MVAGSKLGGNQCPHIGQLRPADPHLLEQELMMAHLAIPYVLAVNVQTDPETMAPVLTVTQR